MNLKYLALLLILSLALSSVSAYNVSHTKIIGVRELDNGELRGVAANLTVEVHEGSGRVFVEIKPLTQVDTQASARLAKEVACKILEMDCDKYDFYYIIESDFEIIGGPSAGAAMTAATLAALQGVEMNQDVFITGTINPAGSIGPVGSIIEKAEAAYENGAKIFIIPKGQGINYVEQTGETINITTLAKKNWGLEIIEARDIIEAYKYLTGYQIIIKKVTSAEIASQKYNEVMKVLSKNLISEAREMYKESENKLNSSDITFSKIDEIKNDLEQSNTYLEQAAQSYEKNNFYSASSFSVRSQILSRYVINEVEYYEMGETKDYVEDKLSKVNTAITSFETLFLKNRKIDDYGDIEIYSVVIDRIREAEDILNSAYDAYSEQDFNRALYLAAFAEVRKNTAYSWLTLISEFKGNLSLEFDPSNVKDIAQERIQQSKTSIVYARTVANNQILTKAEEHLESAITAFNEQKYVFALFEASKARAEANLAMESRAITNETVQDKISELENEAKLAIKKAEEKGLLPILALSYLEFGKTLRYNEPVQSLIYLSYSKEMAQISQDLVEATIGKSLIPKEVNIEKYYEPTTKMDRQTQLAMSITILIAGILCGATISTYLIEKNK